MNISRSGKFPANLSTITFERFRETFAATLSKWGRTLNVGASWVGHAHLGRCSTSSISARRLGVVYSCKVSVCAASNTCRGFPRHRSPETAVFVSATTRTGGSSLSARRLDFCFDFGLCEKRESSQTIRGIKQSRLLPFSGRYSCCFGLGRYRIACADRRLVNEIFSSGILGCDSYFANVPH